MNTPSYSSLVFSGLVVALVSVLTDRAMASDAYETPPTFKASDILPRALLSGPHHRVREEVVNDGYICLLYTSPSPRDS